MGELVAALEPRWWKIDGLSDQISNARIKRQRGPISRPGIGSHFIYRDTNQTRTVVDW
jgi:hypothetical protein